MAGTERYEISIGASYLREQAHRCVRLARNCPHTPTSHQLEAIGAELMLKAEEIDELLSDLGESSGTSRST